MAQENERFNLTNLKKILEEKYGPAKPDSAQTETNKSFQIGQGTNYISLLRFDYGSGPILSISYENLDLSIATYDEQKKRIARLKEQEAQHQEQIQKKMQEDLKDKL